jgi:hypothetical protein
MVTALEQGAKGSKRYSLIDKVQGFNEPTALIAPRQHLLASHDPLDQP